MEPTFRAMGELGWKVIKVDDGHDLRNMLHVVENAYADVVANPRQPVFIWAKTIKGKGVRKTELRFGRHGFRSKPRKNFPSSSRKSTAIKRFFPCF